MSEEVVPVAESVADGIEIEEIPNIVPNKNLGDNGHTVDSSHCQK